jgi:hypothetical protein
MKALVRRRPSRPSEERRRGWGLARACLIDALIAPDSTYFAAAVLSPLLDANFRS